MTNSLGQTEKILVVDHVSSISVDVKELAAGIYFISLHTRNGVITRKMLKQ